MTYATYCPPAEQVHRVAELAGAADHGPVLALLERHEELDGVPMDDETAADAFRRCYLGQWADPGRWAASFLADPEAVAAAPDPDEETAEARHVLAYGADDVRWPLYTLPAWDGSVYVFRAAC